MQNQPNENGSLVISYLTLRQAIGVIGIALPFVLTFGKFLLDGPGIQPSISDYYYTDMRNWFVGSLCAIAVFLGAYRGYGPLDNILTNLAGLFAVGVAFFPTTPLNPVGADRTIGSIHIVCASLFFLLLAFISLKLFTQTNTGNPTVKKQQRNLVYRITGLTILGCIGTIATISLLGDSFPFWQLDPIFWLESIAVIAFGVSWLTKGEAILADA